MATSLLVAGCSTPRLPNSQTASEQFSRLGLGEKRVARTFYDLGAGDEIKRLYWAQRRAQEAGGTAVGGAYVTATQICSTACPRAR